MMKDLTIILQGIVNPHQIEMWKKNHKNSKVIISTWTDCEFNFKGWLPDNWKLIINPYPLLRFAPIANLDYQIISTLKALDEVDTKWVIKMRADEYWSNIDKIYDKMQINSEKIVSGSMFFRKWGLFPFHIGDKILGGTKDNLTLMFESTLQNLEMKLWDYKIPESQLGFGYIIGKDNSINSQYLKEQLANFSNKRTKQNLNVESITTSIYKGLEVVTQKSFGILTNEFNYSAKKIYFDDIKKELDYMIQILTNVSANISDFRFTPLDDKPYMKKWFDIIDVNELKPYVATRNFGNGRRVWYKDDFNNNAEDCLTNINK
jgi:hypothetical protein